jgi:formamidopyrimidine-DNA glycosylase
MQDSTGQRTQHLQNGKKPTAHNWPSSTVELPNFGSLIFVHLNMVGKWRIEASWKKLVATSGVMASTGI